jgi:hypothetical protein
MTNIGERIGEVAEKTATERKEVIKKKLGGTLEKAFNIFLSADKVVGVLGKEGAEKVGEIKNKFFNKIEKAKEKLISSYEDSKENAKSNYKNLKGKAINLGLEKVVWPVEDGIDKICEVPTIFSEWKSDRAENNAEKKAVEAADAAQKAEDLRKAAKKKREGLVPLSLGRKALLEGVSNEEAA